MTAVTWALFGTNVVLFATNLIWFRYLRKLSRQRPFLMFTPLRPEPTWSKLPPDPDDAWRSDRWVPPDAGPDDEPVGQFIQSDPSNRRRDPSEPSERSTSTEPAVGPEPGDDPT